MRNRPSNLPLSLLYKHRISYLLFLDIVYFQLNLLYGMSEPVLHNESHLKLSFIGGRGPHKSR